MSTIPKLNKLVCPKFGPVEQQWEETCTLKQTMMQELITGRTRLV